MTTIVVTPIEFDGSEIELHGDAYHHLFRVKRLRAGESVRVVDGEGRARRGVVARVDRARGVVALGSSAPSLEPPLRLELLVAPPKPDRAAWLVEKATEIGVAAIRFVATDRAARDERSFGSHQLARLHRVATAAVEQCGRAAVPDVSGIHPFRETLEQARHAGRAVVVLDPSGERSPSALGTPPSAGLSVVVGPEGGWSEEELEVFRQEGVPLWSAGDRILRVETAALVVAAVALATATSPGSKS